MNPNHLFKIPKIKIPKIWFMRHAETDWNIPETGRVQGRSPDPSITLSHAGRLAAKSVLPLLPKPNVLVTSPLLRCKQTAELWFDTSFDHIPITTQIRSDLMEIHAGIYEGRLITELQSDPLWQQWMRNPLLFPGFPGGESLPKFADRILRGVGEVCAEYENTDQEICILTHGVAMRVLKCFVADQSLSSLWTHKVLNLEQMHLTTAQYMKFHRHYSTTGVHTDSKPNASSP